MNPGPSPVFLLILIACIIVTAGCTGTYSSSPAQTPAAVTATPAGTTAILLAGVPDVRQAENYSCGASSLQAVMSYYGLNAMESDLRGILNTSPSHGTYPWDMVQAARGMGFDAEWKENLSLNDLESALREGTPVIIDGQRFYKPNSTWEDTWDAGHYMVVIGMDDRNVYLEDPYILGSRLNMTRDAFLASWHDYESEIPVPAGAKKYYHLGVFIRGTPPQERPEYIGPEVAVPYIPYVQYVPVTPYL
jgi:predicted double-glycine peptidase